MRIANIIEEARIGGPQIRNLMIAKALKDQFTKVTLIFPKKNSTKLISLCRSQKINYYSLPLGTIERKFISIFKYVFFFVFDVVKIAKILKKHNFDLVHLSGGAWQFKGIFAAKLAGIKVIWELNDTYTPAFIKNLFFFLSYLANGFIFASQKTKNYYKSLIPNYKKTFIIQSPVDINLFNPNLKYSLKKSDKKIFNNKIVIGTVANINPTKDLVMIINSAKQLSFYSNKIVFVLVGAIYRSQIKYYKMLKKIINKHSIKNLFFLKSRSDIRPLLKNMDIYLCTSKNESSPLSVWEAMSMKKAIISTKVGDVNKFIKNNINGFIIKSDEKASLANKIQVLIKNSKLRKKFGERSRLIAKNKLHIAICVNLHLNAYQKIFAQNKKIEG